jgi:hypothetical protein
MSQKTKSRHTALVMIGTKLSKAAIEAAVLRRRKSIQRVAAMGLVRFRTI